MNFRYKPYNLFLLASVFFVLYSFFVNKGSVDVFGHDEYLVIANQHWMLFWAILFALLYLFYRLLKNVLASSVLSWIHVIVTLLFAVLLNFIPWDALESNRVEKTVYTYDDFDSAWNVGYAILLILLAAQLIFPINIIQGIMKRSAKRNR